LKLGPYEVVAALGTGGMGEVYRGRDARLKRDVALKILPSTFAADVERLARFEREAQALAALNHPNIAAIYGLEESAGVRALVLELVEGETLAERIARGRLPVDEALAIARQIASALEVAHEQGIVHRDLKPANVKVTPDGTVKVLDFGLAKLVTGVDSGRVPVSGFAGPTNQDPAHGSGDRALATGAPTIGTSARPDVTASPTMTSPALMTGAGMLLGTAAYMAPEQARGKAVDKRADIWAFGVVLYEMLTGTRAFGGDSVTETAGAVIHKDVDWSAVPSDLLPSARTVLKRCLEKDPSRRARDIGDVRLALDGAFESETSERVTQPAKKPGQRVAEIAAIALIAALVSGIGVWMLTRPAPPDQFPVRVQIPGPGPSRLGPFVSLSPNGRHLAYIALDDTNAPRIWVHSLEAGESRILASAGVVRSTVFWSPDSQSIGFAAEGKLKKIDIVGGPAETISDADIMTGGTWTRGDVILFADQRKGGIMQVAASGGTPVQRTVLDKARQETGHFLPVALPDGRHFFYLRTSRGDDTGIFIGDIEATPEQQSSTRLLAAAQGIAYVPASGAARGGCCSCAAVNS
jgi:serine/threonine protein kinase